MNAAGLNADATIGLWLAVLGFGVYHGLNPAMGWPLAVANGLTERRSGAVFATALPLGVGHLMAMAVVLVPFALLSWYVEWSRAVRFGAGALVLLYGVYRLIERRHPRFLLRVRPSQLTWWSFLTATAHGAGLMLVPITLSLCAPAAAGSDHAAQTGLLTSNVVTAVTVALTHTAAMIVSGVTIAWLVYRYLGLRFLKRGWFNLDMVWAASLVLTGGVSCAFALLGAH
ncbi:MAG: hypothetical protein ACR2GP_05585 [Burkholderiaceae bacterium]